MRPRKDSAGNGFHHISIIIRNAVRTIPLTVVLCRLALLDKRIRVKGFSNWTTITSLEYFLFFIISLINVKNYLASAAL